MEESEFGKGLVICLVKLAEHRWRWVEQRETWKEMEKKHPDLFTEADAVHSHFNGASDHLYEIEVPPQWKGTKLGKAIEELKELGLKIGHSGDRESWSESDVDNVYNMCQQVAALVDKKLGLKPQIGSW